MAQRASSLCVDSFQVWYRNMTHSSSEAAHALVIGSGFGGLAAAVRLGAKGYRVTVLERLDAPGGRAYVYRQDGYTFDGGPTIVTAPFVFEELWTLCGRRMADDVTLKEIDPFYGIRFEDGEVLDCTGDVDRMRANIAAISPDDAKNFDRYLNDSEEVYRTAFEDMGRRPFDTLGVLAKSVPDLVRLGGHRSVFDKVRKYFTHPKIQIAFSFHPLLVGGNPFSTTSFYTLIAHLERSFGVHYAMGGTGALVRGLVGLIEGQGGFIRYDCEVDEITVRDGRASGVRLKNGESIDADLVVSNADAAWTYTQLLRNVPRKRWTDRKLQNAKYSMSLFVWYFGTKRRYEDVHHHMMVLGPRYRDLLDDIFNRKVLADDFSLYLHRPTATDPAMAPDGCDAFYVLSPVPHLDSGVDWAQMAEPYRKKIEARLEETVLPGLGEALATSHVLTPQDFHNRLCSVKGAAFSLEPQLFQSAYFRPHNRSEELPGLYLVGAGTHPGAGLPGVVTSAKVMADRAPDAAALKRAA